VRSTSPLQLKKTRGTDGRCEGALRHLAGDGRRRPPSAECRSIYFYGPRTSTSQGKPKEALPYYPRGPQRRSERIRRPVSSALITLNNELEENNKLKPDEKTKMMSENGQTWWTQVRAPSARRDWRRRRTRQSLRDSSPTRLFSALTWRSG